MSGCRHVGGALDVKDLDRFGAGAAHVWLLVHGPFSFSASRPRQSWFFPAPCRARR